ncbi:MAG: hypothetical protein HUU26_01915 [Gemmatimonadaceae bacterium]|nr:hypothetical protein [Gemmatimonadaceae bacterium]
MLISKRRWPVAAAALVLGAAACAGGDERTEQVLPGMSRDSVLATLGSSVPGATAESAMGADSLRNVWRRTQYLVDGVNIEVIWYSPSGEKRTAADTVPEERVIPVVLLDGKVAGVGRSAYDRVAETYRLPRNRY